MTQPNQSELDNLVQILGKYHDAEPHRYLEAADIVAYITANYTANSEIAEREQLLLDELEATYRGQIIPVDNKDMVKLADVQSIYRGIKDFINAKRGKK